MYTFTEMSIHPSNQEEATTLLKQGRARYFNHPLITFTLSVQNLVKIRRKNFFWCTIHL